MKQMKKTPKYIIGTLAVVLIIALSATIYFKHVSPVQILEGEGDCVILLHGLGRISSSMEPMAQYLNETGFKTVNIDYPSTKHDIETLSNLYLKPAVSKYCNDSDKIDFVTHSLGGIIVRHYLENNELENLGKVVMMAPPNQGTELADSLKEIGIVSWIMGPALSELGTDIASMPLSLPEPDYDVYVIAGSDDGKVSIEEAKLKNMKGFLLVPSNHTFIMDKEEVQTAVKNFLEE